ncbi:MAG: MFS transporter [Candidatus Helarchaeota archaeon]
MPSLENNWYRRLLFMTVYLIESIITITTLAIFPILLTDLGLDPVLYGVFGSISLLPMVFKFFIGPISDRFPIPFLRGRRRGYILIGALLNIITLPFLSLNPTILFALFFIMWFFQSLGIAILDILTDALAIEGTKKIQNERGRTGASGWMFLGILLGGLFVFPFTSILDGHTMTPSAPFDPTVLLILGIIAALSVIPLILYIFLKEENERPKKRDIIGDIKRNLKHPFVKMGLIFALLLMIDGGLLELTLEPFVKKEFGFTTLSEAIIPLVYVGLLGSLFGLVGYWFIDKIKKNRLLIIINLIYIIPSVLLGAFILSGNLTYELFLILYGVYSFVGGLSYVTYMGLFFDLSDPTAAGTMIALYLSFINLGMAIGVAFSGLLSIGLIYIVVAIICAIRTLPLSRINMDEVQKTFYQKPNMSEK